MATLAASQNLIDRLLPDQYDGRVDIEEFIQDCQRFFDVANMDDNMRNIMIKTLMNRELIPIYEAVENNIVGYEARLRKAFQKPSSLVNDIKEIFEFRKGSISAEKYFDTINKLTDKLLRHKWDKKELTKYFLIHCVDSKEIQKEIKTRNISDVTDIEKLIKKMDSISEEVEIRAVQRIT